MSDERLKIAVFIDFDNIEIGVKNTLGLQLRHRRGARSHQGAR